MSVLQQYKCPCCDGAIEFDSTVQKMKCPYCDTEFEMENLAALDDVLNQETSDDLQWDNSAGSAWQDGETEGLRVYVCKSCGGEIVADETTGASSCPSSGSALSSAAGFLG